MKNYGNFVFDFDSDCYIDKHNKERKLTIDYISSDDIKYFEAKITSPKEGAVTFRSSSMNNLEKDIESYEETHSIKYPEPPSLKEVADRYNDLDYANVEADTLVELTERGEIELLKDEVEALKEKIKEMEKKLDEVFWRD